MNRLGVGGNYVYCLFIVVIFMGLGRAKREEDLKSLYGGKLKWGSHRVKGGWGGITFYGGVDPCPQVF